MFGGINGIHPSTYIQQEIPDHDLLSLIHWRLTVERTHLEGDSVRELYVDFLFQFNVKQAGGQDFRGPL